MFQTVKAVKALSALAALGWTGQVYAYPTAGASLAEVKPRASSNDLLPISQKSSGSSTGKFANFISTEPTDYQLKDTMNFFYGRSTDLAIARLSGDAIDENSKLFYNGQFQDDIQATHCGTDGVNVVFKDQTGYNDVKTPLGWLSSNSTVGTGGSRSIMFIADDANCGQLGRDIYKIMTVSYDDASMTVNMKGSPIDWENATKNLTIDIDTRGFGEQSGTARRDLDETMDLSKFDQSGKQIYSGEVYQGINATVTCSQCGLEGSVHLQAHYDVLKFSVKGSLDMSGLAINLGLGLGLEASIPEQITWDQHLPQIPLLDPPVQIHGLKLGPALVLGARATIDELSASLELGPIGGKLSFPNNPHIDFSVGLDIDGDVTDGSFSPTFEAFEPQLTVDVQGKGSISPYMTLGLGVEITSKIGASAGVVVDAPSFGFEFEAAASTGAAVCDANLGLALHASIDGTLSFFAGLDPIESAHDIIKAQIFSANFYTHDWCFAVGGDDGGDGGNTGGDGGNSGGSGVDQIWVEWYKDTEYAGGEQAFWCTEDSTCRKYKPEP